MSLIANLKINNEKISFDLINISKEIKISLANAIRRTIISDITTYAIHDVTFFENTSMLNNQFLKHRLNLIPIISNMKNINYENIIISCKKKNENENIESIYVSDFVCTDSETNLVIDNNLIFKYPKILFGKLNNNNFISFEAKLMNNNSEYGGSFFSPVSACIYTPKIDVNRANEITSNMSESEKKIFGLQEIERVYEKNEIGDPNIYQFVVESIGFYEPLEIILLGLEALVTKLHNVKIEFRNSNSKKVILNEMDDSQFYIFTIDHENETVGNILSTYITYHNNVFYSGYVIEHPLKYNILLKVKLHTDNNLENVILIIEETIDNTINVLDRIKNDLILAHNAI